MDKTSKPAPAPPPAPPRTPAMEREARLASALRLNLRRRKLAAKKDA